MNSIYCCDNNKPSPHRSAAISFLSSHLNDPPSTIPRFNSSLHNPPHLPSVNSSSSAAAPPSSFNHDIKSTLVPFSLPIDPTYSPFADHTVTHRAAISYVPGHLPHVWTSILYLEKPLYSPHSSIFPDPSSSPFIANHSIQPLSSRPTHPFPATTTIPRSPTSLPRPDTTTTRLDLRRRSVILRTPVVSFAHLLFPTGALCSEIERRDAISFAISPTLTPHLSTENQLCDHILARARHWISLLEAHLVDMPSVLKLMDQLGTHSSLASAPAASFIEDVRAIIRGGTSLASLNILHLLTIPDLAYDPSYLDDPMLTTGRHKTIITLPGMLSSILQYTRPSDLKLELNNKFRLLHPEVHPTLMLSQIRNLKRKLLDISVIFDLEVSSVAKAYVYLEKLIMKEKTSDAFTMLLIIKQSVAKYNRRLIGAICLLLASKVNEPKENVEFGDLLHAMTKILGVSANDIFDHEFEVFALLEFNLYLPPYEYMPHIERIFQQRGLQNYISKH